MAFYFFCNICDLRASLGRFGGKLLRSRKFPVAVCTSWADLLQCEIAPMIPKLVDLMSYPRRPDDSDFNGKNLAMLKRHIWVWLKIKQEGLRRFWPLLPLTRVPCWYRFNGTILGVFGAPLHHPF